MKSAFLILLVSLAFLRFFAERPGIVGTNPTVSYFKTYPLAIDTNQIVWFEGKPLRYYQYIKHLKTGKYTIITKLDINNRDAGEDVKELIKLTDRQLGHLKMDSASIRKRIADLLFKPSMMSFSQLDTNITIYHNNIPLRYYQYMPILLTGKYLVQMDSGRRSIIELSGPTLQYLNKDSISINNMIVNWLSRADRIVVEKAKRRLYIERNGKRLFDFPIQLGKAPVGHKLKEGDGRTPEGIYYLDYNVNSYASYHLGFHISYPNADDIARSSKQGVKPGGDVMIHGTSAARAKLKDWTNGCIALSNAHIDTLMKYYHRTIPIEIRK
ncbi:L,D-transpeptidase family protein [Mucilaginibacter auburnensis]|uniref:L,D-transpeptidase-like protein n=1 Tax=Mucilaginibacter auburnensis TaxID=1457233 RepID=A0A2H9VRX9_9SPHI|nr:L,D-transpeptidase family protein [Mucilaginibacter auburnensis]PJJ83587.1 L,D-transpeptidase-like protein [Mucilaginibacter auburnensis]